MKTKLKIGAFDWSFTDEATKMGNNLGLCNYEKLELTVKRNLIPSVKSSTVLHELIHAMFDSCGYVPKDEEDVVDVLANQLFLFIQNNPKFFKEFILDSAVNSKNNK